MTKEQKGSLRSRTNCTEYKPNPVENIRYYEDVGPSGYVIFPLWTNTLWSWEDIRRFDQTFIGRITYILPLETWLDQLHYVYFHKDVFVSHHLFSRNFLFDKTNQITVTERKCTEYFVMENYKFRVSKASL